MHPVQSIKVCVTKIRFLKVKLERKVTMRGLIAIRLQVLLFLFVPVFYL